MPASGTPDRKKPRSIPRWGALALSPVALLIAIPLAHGVVPWAISLFGPRYGWDDGRPSYWNLLGLVPVSAGAMVLVWLMVLGFTQASKMPERIELDWSPKILLTRGPYAFSRHPMYLAELALWLGWAILYGSLAVLAGCLVLCIVVCRLVLKEERELEAKFGETYREYMLGVPRWLGIRSRPPGPGRDPP